MFYFTRGMSAYRKQEFTKAFELFVKAARKEDYEAYYMLGRCYHLGRGTNSNEREAYKWYTKALSGGHQLARKAIETLQSEQEKAQEARKAQEKEKAALERKMKDKSNATPIAAVNLPMNSSLPANPPPNAPIGNPALGDVHFSFEIEPEELVYDMQINPYTAVEEPVFLGQGGFGEVYKATWRHQSVAVKVLAIQSLNNAARSEFMNEVQVMVNLRVPQVVALYGISLAPRYQLVMEYCSNGSLFDYLHSDRAMDWGMRGRIALEVAQGLAFLHACRPPILHRDIKSHNILLDRNYSAKLADFGLSRLKQESCSTSGGQQDSVGTVAWMAPELFKQQAKYVKGSDMYSYGMVLWELSTRLLPWREAEGRDKIVIMQWVKEGEREDIPENTPSLITTLIKQCWEDDPDKRPSAEEVMNTLAQSLGELEKLSGATESGTNAPPASVVPSSVPGYQDLASQNATTNGAYQDYSGAFFSSAIGTPSKQLPSTSLNGYQDAPGYFPGTS
ncbi:MAG: protein kinase [Gammaproteobacteria bacterium]